VQSEFLFTVAEVAVAFAGFAGLIVAISGRQGRSAAEVRLDLVLLANVLSASLMTVAFAFIPATLLGMDVEPSIAWRGSAFLYAVSLAVYSARALPGQVASYRAAGRSVPLTFRMNSGLVMVAIVSQGLCAAGVLPTLVYLPSLLLLLYVSGVSFVRVFLSVVRANAD
jgi:hypothetical protein